MDRRQRVPFWVLIGLEIGCLLMLAVGLFSIASPFWIPAGVLGLIDGYDAQTDILGLVWLVGSVGSIFIGVLLTGAAALTAIWAGIAAGLIGLASRRASDASSRLAMESIPDRGTDLGEAADGVG